MNAHVIRVSFCRQTGFTLLELIVSITVATIVVAFAAMFLATPIQAYLAQARRAELVNAADMVMRNLDRDIRTALPNSVRVTQSGGVWALEMLNVVDVARYRDEDSLNIKTQELEFGNADKQFGAFAKFSPASHPSNLNANYLVINHSWTPGANAYALDHVITSTAAIKIIDSPNNTTPDEDEITLKNAFKFAGPSPTHRMYLVSGPITYLCDAAAHTLVRYANYTLAANQSARDSATKLLNAGATATAIANNVGSCQFDYQFIALHDRLVGVQLAVSQSGEDLPVFMQVPIENVP